MPVLKCGLVRVNWVTWWGRTLVQREEALFPYCLRKYVHRSFLLDKYQVVGNGDFLEALTNIPSVQPY